MSRALAHPRGPRSTFLSTELRAALRSPGLSCFPPRRRQTGFCFVFLNESLSRPRAIPPQPPQRTHTGHVPNLHAQVQAPDAASSLHGRDSTELSPSQQAPRPSSHGDRSRPGQVIPGRGLPRNPPRVTAGGCVSGGPRPGADLAPQRLLASGVREDGSVTAAS